MVKAGQYAEYPLPDEWRAILAHLLPASAPPTSRALPSLGHLIDACLAPLADRDRRVIWGRLGEGQTLQQLGTALTLTRERVRQIERGALRTVLLGPQLRLVLGGVRTAFEQAGTLVLDLHGAHSQLVPDAIPDQLWNFLCTVWENHQPTSGHSVQLAPAIWLYTTSDLLHSGRLEGMFGSSGQFLPNSALAATLDLEPDELLALSCASAAARPTVQGWVGLNTWTLPQWAEAVAVHLARHGVTEWHFSQMARALEVVAPDVYPSLTGRNVAAVLSRPGVTCFEYAGRKGCWRLREYGDGHTDNRAAIRAVLDAADLPLHSAEIQRRLRPGRDIAQGTIVALLEREAEFRAWGNGVYGVAATFYPAQYREEAWLSGLLRSNNASELPAEQVHWAARAASFDPARLEAIGRFSSQYRYWKHHQAEACYLTPEHARLKVFGRWFEHRAERRLPPSPVLIEGLRQDPSRLTAIRAVFEERGEPLPEELQQWLAEALAR